jgi:menaquinone-dependent protoporphyrinogen oxidase
MRRILVLYGTNEGHTEMIATAIGNTLTTNGFDVDVIQAGTMEPTLSTYDGIIVAASVHGGTFQKSVVNWVRANRAGLANKVTAFVPACLAIVSQRQDAIAEVDKIIARFVEETGWRPSITKPVAGALLYTKYNVLMRWIMKRIVAKQGGDIDTSRDYDYTDWTDLRRFAAEFGRRFTAAA